ncbi:MAG: hypothetical protein V2I33_11295 [Kangiellaceae bacterium]|nr:hypothetical protein [Kangiellaceae bacterium]
MVREKIARSCSLLSIFAVSFIVAGCTSDDPIADSSQSPDPTVTDFPLAYVKRTIPVDEDGNRVDEIINEPANFNPGAALFIRDRALPSAIERNITDSVFSDPNAPDTVPQYDVKDLAISPDGLKLAFAMRAPEIPNADDEDQPKWNIWEYDLETNSLRRVISSDIVAEDGHDIQPAYLTDGRIVFSSSRQRLSKAILLDEGKPQFSGQDEDDDSDAFVLHVMDNDGTNIEQITFNQSHDFYPSLLTDGRIVFLRWDNMVRSNAQSLYTVHPDGTNLQRLYGYHSQDTGPNGSQTLFTKSIQAPSGEVYALGKVAQSLNWGGDPIAIDVNNYIEADQMVDGSSGSGQVSIASDVISIDDEPSLGGLFHNIFPLWDGTGNRLLISWSPCLLREVDPVTNENISHPCTDENLALYDDGTYLNGIPSYGIWTWDRDTNSQTPIVVAEEGTWVTEPVIFQARQDSPTFIPDGVAGIDLDQQLVNENVGVLHIRSVYDFDGVDVTANGIAAMADPAQTPVDARPARFLRLVKAVSMPSDEVYDFDNTAFGRDRGQLMREILGYVPIEPDGSVKVKVPANVAFTISVLDQYGQRISARHNNWMQLKLGEQRECTGCHSNQSEVSHGRADADPLSVYPGSLGNSPFPNSVSSIVADDGETMAQANTRINGVPEPTLDIQFTDIWTDGAVAIPGSDINYLYQDLTTASPITNACATNWFAGCRITIHFQEHIQPIFDYPRVTFDTDGQTVLQDDTCVTCHSTFDMVNNIAQVPAGQLELTSLASPDEPNHYRSYRELFFNDNAVEVVDGAVVDLQVPRIVNGSFIFQTIDGNGQTIFFLDDDGMFVFEPDPNTGLPIEMEDTDGSPIYQTDVNGNPLFETDADGNQVLDNNGNPIPLAIALPVPLPNQLTETVNVGPILRSAGAVASSSFFDLFRTGTHQGMLSDAELRLIAEWLDIGGQYFNNPFLAPEN